MSTCKRCNQPIRWVTTTGQGKRLPLDPSSDPDGTIRVRYSGAEGKKANVLGEVLSGAALDAAIADEDLLFSPHRCHSNATHNPMPDSVRAFRDALPAPRTPRRRSR